MCGKIPIPGACGGAPACRLRRAVAFQSATAAPKPNQPGSIRAALCPGKHPRNGTQVFNRRALFTRGWTAADVERGNFGNHGRFPEILFKPWCVIHQGSIGIGTHWSRALPWLARNSVGGLSKTRGSRVASSVAAARTSRLRRPSSGLAYLEAMTSPCSVMRICPCTAPCGCAKNRLIARPATTTNRAAAPVKQPQAHAMTSENLR
jgi:hypothetical protein